jgi:hypothetical protein
MQNNYASRTSKVQFLINIFSYFWFCFVVLQIIVFNVIFQWNDFGDGAKSLLFNLYGECES